MFELPLLLLVMAGIVWLMDRTPWNFGAEMVTPEGFTLDEPEPEEDPKQANLMFKKGGSAPAPDPRIGQAAIMNAKLGKEWFGLAEEQFREASKRQGVLDKITGEIGREQLETMRRASDWSQEDRQRMEEVFRPLEDQLVRDAKLWDSQERQKTMAAEAKADVLTNAQQAKEANRRNMASMGVRPDSGRYTGVERATDFNTALAGADAQNRARNRVRQEGLALRGEAMNVGRGLPSQAAGAAGLGLQAGNSAQGQYLRSAGNQRSNMGIMNAGFGGAMQGNSSMANILSNQYGQELQSWNAQQQAAGQAMQGIGQLAGTAGTLALMSSEKFKTDKKEIHKSALEGIKNMDIENWRYKKGYGDDGAEEHTGGYAEDFKRETGRGDGKTIPVGDAIGVTMKAVQELDDKVTKVAKALPALDEVKKGKGKRKTKRTA